MPRAYGRCGMATGHLNQLLLDPTPRHTKLFSVCAHTPHLRALITSNAIPSELVRKTCLAGTPRYCSNSAEHLTYGTNSRANSHDRSKLLFKYLGGNKSLPFLNPACNAASMYYTFFCLSRLATTSPQNPEGRCKPNAIPKKKRP